MDSSAALSGLLLRLVEKWSAPKGTRTGLEISLAESGDGGADAGVPYPLAGPANKTDASVEFLPCFLFCAHGLPACRPASRASTRPCGNIRCDRHVHPILLCAQSSMALFLRSLKFNSHPALLPPGRCCWVRES
jgi:hypothetical protein